MLWWPHAVAKSWRTCKVLFCRMCESVCSLSLIRSMFVLHLRSAALCRAMVPVLMVDAGSGEAVAPQQPVQPRPKQIVSLLCCSHVLHTLPAQVPREGVHKCSILKCYGGRTLSQNPGELAKSCSAGCASRCLH
jgi:hypothetical protein